MWSTVIIKLRVNVQNVLLQQNMFVAVMEEHISMNANSENNLVQRKLILEFFIQENAVSTLISIQLITVVIKFSVSCQRIPLTKFSILNDSSFLSF